MKKKICEIRDDVNRKCDCEKLMLNVNLNIIDYTSYAKSKKHKIVLEILIFDSLKGKKRRNFTPRGMQFCLFSFCTFV